jgi:hypothetical protein
MIRNSQVVRSVRETVSLDTLQKKLPQECYNALVHHLSEPTKQTLDDSIYQQYFCSEATPVLNDEEKKELFETMGSQLVKGHYSTQELREFLDSEPKQKRNR